MKCPLGCDEEHEPVMIGGARLLPCPKMNGSPYAIIGIDTSAWENVLGEHYQRGVLGEHYQRGIIDGQRRAARWMREQAQVLPEDERRTVGTLADRIAKPGGPR